MSKPLGLSQQDYEELEKPRPAPEPLSPLPGLSLWDNCLWVIACLTFLVCLGFFFVTALLCRMVTGRWPR
jgi:hypothetical protein